MPTVSLSALTNWLHFQVERSITSAELAAMPSTVLASNEAANKPFIVTPLVRSDIHFSGTCVDPKISCAASAARCRPHFPRGWPKGRREPLVIDLVDDESRLAIDRV